MKMKKEKAVQIQADLCIPCQQKTGRQAVELLLFTISLSLFSLTLQLKPLPWHTL